MSEPIIEQIAAKIKTAVAAITVAAGFQQDLSAVRPTRLGWAGDAAPVDGKVVVIEGDPQIDDENSAEGSPPMRAWVHPFYLTAFVIADDTATTAIGTRINRVRSDLEKKLREDPTWGGLALDTRIAPPIAFNEAPEFSGVVVTVEVLYRTREDDPYQQA